MSVNENLICLVALLRHGEFRSSLMPLRQRLVEGETPSQILRDQENSYALYEAAKHDVFHWLTRAERPLCWLDENYPPQLREVHDFPPVIFVRGTVDNNDRGICIVGSRDAQSHDLQIAQQTADFVVDAGYAVVSGLAKGIDTAAHAVALNRRARTVAVLGTGIDQYYPPQNRQMQKAIEKEGLVLSQFWPGTAPKQFSFPMRNAVMSAYANATIIVSATENSGTRHQARQAVAHARPLVVTRDVYEHTTWARKLVDDPAVYARVGDLPQNLVEIAIEMANFSVAELAANC